MLLERKRRREGEGVDLKVYKSNLCVTLKMENAWLKN